MNATPMNINPANAPQAQPAAGKQQDSATAETPFSQVLSSEMAQARRNGNAAREGAGADAGAEAATQAARPTEADASSTSIAADTAAETAEAAADALALPVAEDAAILPQALLALGISPDQLKPTPAGVDRIAADDAPALAADTLPLLTARKAGAALTEMAGQAGDRAGSTRTTDPALPSGKADPQADRAAVAAFSGQLAAARQAENQKTRELVSELMNTPALRPGAQAPLETLSTPSETAAPRLSPTVGTTAWGQALGEKIVWMAAGAQQSATLTLNPPNLGPLQIVLNVSNEQATASFFSAQPEVRQALEAAFPRLREMMNEAGIQLGQATVSADTPRQNDTPDRQAQRAAPPFSGADDTVTAGQQTLHAPILRSGRGLIDTFA